MLLLLCIEMNWLVSRMSWLPGSVMNQDAYQTQVKQLLVYLRFHTANELNHGSV